MYYIGIDLGTSSVKLLMLDGDGKIVKTATRDYPLIFPEPGWSEQDPNEWYDKTLECLQEILADVDPKQVDGISFGGQMHGMVILDKNDQVLRPAILWNDGRTQEETDYLNDVVGQDILVKNTGNIAFAGFTAPKILWVRNHEPEIFEKIEKIMLPKDYLAYKLSGTFCTEYSDAAGMLLLDVANKCWSKVMLEICGITEKQLPKLFESYDVVGTIVPEIAAKFGLSEQVKIIAGAGDNAAAAIGTGTCGDAKCNVSIGTSGTIFISSKNYSAPKNPAIHSFCHADGHFHLMGVTLSAGSSYKWFMEDILEEKDLAGVQQKMTGLGENPVFFMPYLMGERCPHNDTQVRAMFYGMSMDTTRAQMAQAVMEGVAFAFRDCYEIAKDCGIVLKKTKICGGGAKSPLWRKIIANVLNLEVEVIESEQGPGLGGAMLAMVGCGAAKSVEEVADRIVKVVDTVKPDPELVEKYNERYEVYTQFYPAVKGI